MRTRTWLIALGVSVALNVFFVGWLSARAWQERAHRVERPRQGPLDPGARRAWQRPRPFDWMTDDERAELRPRRRGLRSARHDAEAALRADPFDAEQLRQALGKLRTDTDAIQASVHEYMLRRASAMSAAERQHLADVQWGPERPERGPERGPGPHGPEHSERGPGHPEDEGR